MICILPPIPKLPDDATDEERRAAFDDYCRLLARVNPHLHDKDGNPISAWGALQKCAALAYGGIVVAMIIVLVMVSLR